MTQNQDSAPVFDIDEFLKGGEPCSLFEDVHQEILEEHRARKYDYTSKNNNRCYVQR